MIMTLSDVFFIGHLYVSIQTWYTLALGDSRNLDVSQLHSHATTNNWLWLEFHDGDVKPLGAQQFSHRIPKYLWLVVFWPSLICEG